VSVSVGVPKEIAEHERRVAATPETVRRMIQEGFQITVERGAGLGSSISDADFQSAGAAIGRDPRAIFEKADMVLKVGRPIVNKSLGMHEVDAIREGAILIALLQPLVNPDLVQKLKSRRLTALSMDMVPRIAKAQSMDALSSQSNVAGYKAVLMAADALGKIMPLMMTAAGTITPVRVLVIGAGVAGLQAVATAKRLGAVVEVFDTRPVVKEQVESLGARFVSFEVDPQLAEDTRGYAKELSKKTHAEEMRLIAEHVRGADVVITTAAIPGKRAPILITKDMVQTMKTGSVIVDLAVESGGNCELIEPGEVTIHQGVTLMGRLNVPSLMAAQSSQLYARNVMHLLSEIYKKGRLDLDLQNEIVRGVLVTHGGEVVHPMLRGAPPT